MGFKGVRLPVILVTLALTLGVLFGGRWLYLNQALDRPLARAVLAVPGVKDVAVGQRSGTMVVRVKAGDAPRLEEFVVSLWQAIDSVDSTQGVDLQISDSRNQALQDVYYNFHFFLQEAVATGRYSELPARLSQVATPDKVTRARVYVGSDYVYLQLHQGEASLYEIVPRQPEGAAPGPGQDVAVRSVTVCPWGG